MLTRRNFLKTLAYLAGAASLPASWEIPIQTSEASGPVFSLPSNLLPSYIAALDVPQFAPVNSIFDDLIGNSGNVALTVYDVLRGQLMAGIQTEAPLPVASAFKGPQFFFFLYSIDPQVWGSVPVEYWRIKDQNSIPAEYREAWNAHRVILYDLYASVVFSDNPSTGRVFAYLADHYGSQYPIALFNDWSHEVVGISQISSLGNWGFGIPQRLNDRDERYLDRTAIINHRIYQFNNVMTARDLGLYYIWWQSQMTSQARAVGEALLSWIADERRSNIEKLAFNLGGKSISKNGSLSVNETGIAPIVTDAGFVNLPDFGYYLVSFLSGNADSRTPKFFERISDIVSGVYDDIVKNQGNPQAIDQNQTEFYTQYLSRQYPESVDVVPGHYNYAFVKYEGVEIYPTPNAPETIRNPVISSSRFGVHLLMQGAMARYVPVDDEWAQLVPDSARDNVQRKLGPHIYVRRSSLHPFHPDRARLIPFFFVANVDAQQKMVIIDVGKREMSFLERAIGVFKTPIVLHDIDTPRGGHTLLTKWLSCSMQPWAPGVPFTAYFHKEGYAIHGSPWQRWEKTVTQSNIFNRKSAGCVNVPDWDVQIGEYEGPLHELTFRWLGGALAPEANIYEYGTGDHPTVWIYVVDRLTDLYKYHMSPQMRDLKIKWDVIIDEVERLPLTAPPSFFA